MFSRDKGLECSPICGSACLCLYVFQTIMAIVELCRQQWAGGWNMNSPQKTPFSRASKTSVHRLFCTSSRLKSELKYFMSSKCPQNNNDNNNKKRNVSREDKQNNVPRLASSCKRFHTWILSIIWHWWISVQQQWGRKRKTFFYSFTIVSEIPKRTMMGLSSWRNNKCLMCHFCWNARSKSRDQDFYRSHKCNAQNEEKHVSKELHELNFLRRFLVSSNQVK